MSNISEFPFFFCFCARSLCSSLLAARRHDCQHCPCHRLAVALSVSNPTLVVFPSALDDTLALGPNLATPVLLRISWRFWSALTIFYDVARLSKSYKLSYLSCIWCFILYQVLYAQKLIFFKYDQPVLSRKREWFDINLTQPFVRLSEILICYTIQYTVSGVLDRFGNCPSFHVAFPPMTRT